ncbi:MAG TPA: TIGR03088 family PEP-CTERM/XrtA system glycosyltransferase [Burkholderiales bacterium]|nr:TIGR03088 family PEP-CTERM/XrtA system glycosyltransferase [Burkholderiales bacterium]
MSVRGIDALHLAKPPLVLHVLHHLHMGGMENGVVNLINNMPPDRFRHAIACIEDYSDFRLRIRRPDIEVLALHRSRVGVWAMRKRLYELCRDMQPAIVHTRNRSGLDALLPARLAGARFCVHGEHGRDVDDLDGENNKLVLLRRLHRPLVTRYITVSKDLQSYLIRRVGVSPWRITQIYNGVDTERFKPVTEKPTGVLPLPFVAQDALVIGTVGRMQAVKDQATLIRAFALLLASRPQAQLYLALVGDGPLRPQLSALATELKIAHRVHLTGALDAVPEALNNLDIFVLPSLGEGISNTILEALASGLPVVATAVGGNVELVQAGESGEFFMPGDAEGLMRLLARYVDDPQLRRAHSAAARRVALRDYSMAAMVESYSRVYTNLLST